MPPTATDPPEPTPTDPPEPTPTDPSEPTPTDPPEPTPTDPPEPTPTDPPEPTPTDPPEPTPTDPPTPTPVIIVIPPLNAPALSGSVSGTSLTLTWTEVTQADQYEVQERRVQCRSERGQQRCGEIWWLTVRSTPGLTETFSGLTVGRAYAYRVCSYRGIDRLTVCSGGQTWTIDPTATPTPIPTPISTPTPPDAPVLTGSRLNGAISLDWDDVSNADGYRLEQCLTPAGVAGCHTYPWEVVRRPDETASNAEITGARPDRDYYFVVSAYRGTNSSARSNRQMLPTPPPTPVPSTATPTPTPLPAPTATILFMETDPSASRSIEFAQWVVLHKNDIKIKVSGTDLGDYEFRLLTNASATGLYVATAHTCNPLGPSDTGWFGLQLTGSTYGEKTISIIRCALGDAANATIELEARRKGSTPITIATPGIQQSWHRDARRISHTIAVSSFTAHGAYRDVVEQSLPLATALWNAVIPSYFAPVAQGSVADVSILAVSDPNDCGDPGALACMKLGTSVHPHYAIQAMWVVTPPKPTNEWTNDPAKAKGPAALYYLPTVIAHEFGHAVGLGHLRIGDGMMGPYWFGNPNTSLAPDDEYGFRRVSEPH